MAGKMITVLDPTGAEGEIPEEDLDGALAAGFKLPAPSAPPEPQQAAELSPVAQGALQPPPVTPPVASPGRQVSVIDPTGAEGTVPESELDGALGAGFKLKDDAGAFVTALQGATRYLGGDLIREGLNKVETFAQDKMIGSGLVTPDVARDYDLFQGREQVRDQVSAHPTAAGIGEAAGIVGSTLIPAARLTPTALLSRGAANVAGKAATSIGPAGAGLIARGARGAISLLTQGAIEGAAYGAAKEVDQAFLRSDYDGIAEKALAGAYDGGVSGAAANLVVGGALNAAGAGVKKLAGAWVGKADDATQTGPVKAAVRKALTTKDGANEVKQEYHRGFRDKFNEWLGLRSKVDNELGLAAKKDWLQRNATDPAPVSLEQVRGMFGLSKAELEALAENPAVKYDAQGGLPAIKRLINKLDEYENALFERASTRRSLTEADVFTAIDQAKRDAQQVVATSVDRRPYLLEVLKPRVDALQAFLENKGQLKPWSEAVADMQAKSNASWAQSIVAREDSDLSKFLGELGEHDPYNEYRLPAKVKDESIAGLFSRAGDANGEQQVRALWNMLDSASADAAVRGRIYGSAGMGETADKMARLVKALKEDVDVVREVNRNTPSDAASVAGQLLIPGAGLAAGGPLGAAGAFAAQKALAPVSKAAGVALTRRLYPSAVRAQTAVNKASKLPGIIGEGAKVLRPAAVKLNVDATLKQLEHLEKEGDPNSPEGQDHQSSLQLIEDEAGPELAEAIGQKYAARARFLLEKAGPAPVDDFGRARPRDPATVQRVARYMAAVDDPVSAIERIGAGTAGPEDLETVKTVYPRMWADFATRALEHTANSKASYEQRVRASLALGIPVDPHMSPSFRRRQNAVSTQYAPQTSASMQPPAAMQQAVPPSNQRVGSPYPADQMAAKSDQLQSIG